MLFDLPVLPANLLMMFFVLPIWLLAGLTDYFCHRASQIEQTSGVPESLMHLLQFGLIAIPALMALTLQVNAAFFFLAAAAIIVHHIVAYLDVRYANSTRRVTAFEQMVHSFLEITPITAFLLLAVVHWSDLMALFGYPPPSGTFGFHLKAQPLPFWYVASAIGAAALLNALPYLEELLRCAATRHRSTHP